MKTAAPHRALLALLLLLPCLAVAAPWLPAGNATLRADVELLAARGLIANLTTTWPIGHAQLARLARSSGRIAQEPLHVQAAAARVLNAIQPQPRRQLRLRLAEQVALIRGFDSSARNQGDGQLVWQGGGRHWDATLQAGVQSRLDGEGARFAPDGTVASTTYGNWRFFAGWPEAWYGAGQMTALSLSSNARPFPKIGFMRDNPVAFESPWLSWLGPWRLDYFVGLLDGERREKHTYFSSFRAAFNPVQGLEVGLARTTMLCGQNHRCDLFRALINVTNDAESTNITNDQGLIDLRYTGTLGKLVVSPYFQHMNDDTGPFAHSYSSHLVGMTVDGPWQQAGARWRLLAEFADTRATLNTFSFSKRLPGLAYNNFDYVDGFRYRGRTIGASLDSDSKLLTLAARYTGTSGLELGLDLHRAQVSSEPLAALQRTGQPYFNTVSATPVAFNELDAKASLPLNPWLPAGELELLLRARDADVAGQGRVHGELGLRFDF